MARLGRLTKYEKLGESQRHRFFHPAFDVRQKPGTGAIHKKKKVFLSHIVNKIKGESYLSVL